MRIFILPRNYGKCLNFHFLAHHFSFSGIIIFFYSQGKPERVVYRNSRVKYHLTPYTTIAVCGLSCILLKLDRLDIDVYDSCF